MFIYLSKKIAIPNGIALCSISWNPEHGWIACGGQGGLLKVLKLDTATSKEVKGPRGIAAPSNLTMNQSLEGHSGAVICSTWNANYRKLTTSDENGLIIVWMLHRGMWFEEMINNRNKSVVTDMKWTSDGMKICIIYEDGAVIVGSVDGNRLWGKELNIELRFVEWSPDGKNIIFVTKDNDVYVHDSTGNKICKMPLYAVEDRHEKDYQIIGIHWYDGCEGHISEDAPTLAIAFREGKVQVTRGRFDCNPVLIDTGMELSECKWSSNGSVLAFAGAQQSKSSSGDSRVINVVQFYTPFGVHLKSLKVPGNRIEALSWEGSGLRICLAVESHIYFANIRPDYHWAYYQNTLVYSFNKPDLIENCVVFWNTRSDEKYVKYIKSLIAIKACGENAVLATKNSKQKPSIKTNSQPTPYRLILCDTIGSPVDTKNILFEPKFIYITSRHVIASSHDVIYTWQYRSPVSKLTSFASSSGDNEATEGSNSSAAALASMQLLRRQDGRERIFYVDDLPHKHPSDIESFTFKERDVYEDPISAICASETCLMVARASGTILRFTLPHISLEEKYVVRCRPQSISLNSNLTRMSIIDINGVLTFLNLEDEGNFDMNENEMHSEENKNCSRLLNFEKKDVWDMMWAEDNPELFVMMEKARMYVYRNLEPEEPVLSSAYLCAYKDLQIRAVLLDEIMNSPDQPEKDLVLDFETKSLRDARELLDNVGLNEACEYIEDHSHPRLWKLLAEAALAELELNMAERGFVQCADYQGIQYVKRLALLKDKMKQKAEVAAYFQKFDEAESIYRQMDRKDLAVDLRMRLGDWFRVVQLVQSGGGDDKLLQRAWNWIGEYYADRHKWEKAAKYYAQSKNTKALIQCYSTLGDFKKLDDLLDSLPDGSELLPELAKTFQRAGICKSGVNSWIKYGDVKSAIDCCAILNQWESAVNLAETYDFPQIDGLLAKYASHLLEKGKKIQAIELYRRANKNTDSAKLLAQLAQDVGKSRNNPVRAKKLHVLAALEVERFRKKMLDTTTMMGTQKTKATTAAQTTAQTLDNLMQHDAATGENRALDNAWRGAEAYHLFLLAHRQLYSGESDRALKTGLKLCEYDDILEGVEVYSLVALAALVTKHYEQCSNAFIRLEALEAAQDQNPVHSKSDSDSFLGLSWQIFAQFPPVDPASKSALSCPGCAAQLPPHATTCDKCARSFQTCMMTGATIINQHIFMCKTCRHVSIEYELKDREHCPLCHATLTS